MGGGECKTRDPWKERRKIRTRTSIPNVSGKVVHSFDPKSIHSTEGTTHRLDPNLGSRTTSVLFHVRRREDPDLFSADGRDEGWNGGRLSGGRRVIKTTTQKGTTQTSLVGGQYVSQHCLRYFTVVDPIPLSLVRSPVLVVLSVWVRESHRDSGESVHTSGFRGRSVTHPRQGTPGEGVPRGKNVRFTLFTRTHTLLCVFQNL